MHIQHPSGEPASIEQLSVGAMARRHSELAQFMIHTPTIACVSDNIDGRLPGVKLRLKLECFQHTGTFKARSAMSSCLSLPQSKRAAGITTASAGNHAIAAAWAARRLGISAKIVMQHGANRFRVEQVKRLGAELVLVTDVKAAFEEASRISRDEGCIFVHPFEGADVILGTAGIGIELLKDVPDLDAVVVSVGGGGLIGGIAAAVKSLHPTCQVYGVEPAGAANLSQSLTANRPIQISEPTTMADSLAPPMCTPFTFAVCAKHVDDVVTVSEEQIAQSVCIMQQEQKLAVEPAAAAALAGILFPLRSRLCGKTVAQIVCGANIGHRDYGDILRQSGAHRGTAHM